MKGDSLYAWAKDIFPITRSLTGEGVRETLAYLGNLLPDLTVYEVPSGTQAFDWTVPDEWTIRDAYIADEAGNRVVDFQQHNLHVVGYSAPTDIWLDRDELEKHLHSLPDQPNAIPYVTSYYVRRWGFCLTHNQREALPSGRYHAVVDSELKPGVLNYAELILPGETSEEVFLSTYICHPSMANNEISGPVVTAALAQWLQSLENHRYTYRIVFVPETIGSIVYLCINFDQMMRQVIAGFNVTCIGDNRCYSYLPSRNGSTLSDQTALHVLKHTDSNFKRYSWLDRGSDERQYCAPGVDLPIATIMRSKYGEYPEYHTSLDNFEVVTPSGLEGGFIALRRSIEIIEQNCYLKTAVLCEPQLGKRGLYPTLSTKESVGQVRAMMNLISYCDGSRTLLEIANLIEEPFWDLMLIVEKLASLGLLEKKHFSASRTTNR
jgi:aminopeptidase-like protein